jgi:DNA modification methylase
MNAFLSNLFSTALNLELLPSDRRPQMALRQSVFAFASTRPSRIQSRPVQSRMTQAIEQIYSKDQRHLAVVAEESRAVVFLSTGFDQLGKNAPHPPRDLQLTIASEKLMKEIVRVLSVGGWLFVYGTPEELPFWALGLAKIGPEAKSPVSPSPSEGEREVPSRMVFKYWIALDLDDTPPGKSLKPSHQGVLMFVKEPVKRKGWPGPRLNIDAARLPHAFCAACGNTLKDWGGKKHLMNPRGAAIADVWRGLTRHALRDNLIPDEVLQRLILLTDAASQNNLHVIQTGRGVEVRDAKAAARGWGEAPDELLGLGNLEVREDAHPTSEPPRSPTLSFTDLASLETDHVYQGDCVSFLRRVHELQPRGAFDLAFADPPYNLEKKYSKYDDGLADQQYLDWCSAWLAGMADTLKPGGSLFVLNLPKWALHHAAFLSARLEFRHWIVWDALSDPRGKIMPAHYALLWFTKPGAKPVCNYAPVGSRARQEYVLPPDSPKYCLRAACIRDRKALGHDEKVELTDIWIDVHRIKHKRDRDAHPCQLPDKLMERILKLATRPGDVVFDPFGGAGTTAIAAAKLGRKFVLAELDPRYVRITNEKLAAMREHADMFGEYAVPRKSVKRKRGDVTKKEIESYLQQLAARLSRMPTEADVLEDRPGLLSEIDLNYPNRGAAFKRAKIGL